MADLLLKLGIKTDFFLKRSERSDNWFAYLAILKNDRLVVEKCEKSAVKVEYDDENISIISTRWSKKYGKLDPIAIDKKSRRNIFSKFNNFRGLIFIVYRNGEFSESKAFDVSWNVNEVSSFLQVKRENLYQSYYSKITNYSQKVPLKQVIIDLIIQGRYKLANEILESVISETQITFDWVYEYFIGLQMEYLGNVELGRTFYKNNSSLIQSSASIHKFMNKYDDKHLMSKLFLSDYIEKNKDQINKIALKISENTGRFSAYPVFVYWGQGFENAPDIVRASFERLKKVVPENALVVLTDKNICDYIDVPDYVAKLSHTNKANYSDYLRFALLAKYGGAWVDATLFVNESFYIQLLEFNSIKPNYPMDGPITLMGSWFRAYKQSSHLGERIMQATTMFWLQNFKSFPFYFFIDFLEQYYADYQIEDGKNRDSFSWQGRKYSFDIRNNLGSKFNEKWAKNIIGITPVHKLNYKITNIEAIKRSDSVYSAILNKKFPFD